MPSGAKKRKAAKKKKSHHTHHSHNHNNNDNNSSHENEEHKSQDERSSDGGSSASRDQELQVDTFNEGNGGPEKGDPSPDQSPVTENESTNNAFAKEEVKDDENEIVKSEIDEVRIEQIEPANNETSNNGSLGDVPNANEEKSVEKEINFESENKPTGNATFTQFDDNLIVEPVSVINEFKSVVPVSEDVVEVVKSALVENSVDYDVGVSALKENAEKLLPAPDDEIEILKAATNNVEESLNNENKNEIINEIKDKTFSVLEENAEASSNLGESAISGVESSTLTSSEDPSTITSRGVENKKDSETEPLVTPVSLVVRKTSWLSCCGIFD